MLKRRPRTLVLLGPAFVAAIAYVDPGNVAANITAGSRYGFALVWVLVLASAMSVVVQYQSAKLGLATGRSLPQVMGQRIRSRPARIGYWLQAEVVAAATDLAEVIGGALALHLLFGLPLVVGGVIVAVVSLGLLAIQAKRRQRTFEFVIVGLLLVITVGFVAGLVIDPPAPTDVGAGLVPRFPDTGAVLVAASMLGATVMPHAIYLHSSLVVDRHGSPEPRLRSRYLHAIRLDVVLALAVAGAVNISLLLVAAQSLRGTPGTDTIEGAHAAIANAFGPAVAVVFAIGLLASGLASTSVGAYAGSEIMAGLLHRRVPLVARRLVTVVPALLVLGFGVEPTAALVVSQVVLSFGIPFVLIPLARLTSQSTVMGALRDSPPLRVVSLVVIGLVVALNLGLVVLTLVP